MVDCRLKRNKNNSRCRIVRSIKNKPKKALSWKEAKARYPKLSPYGNADKDNHPNRKDCRPFDKKKHMVKTNDEGNSIIYATPGEYQAFKKIKYGREMGLPPSETHKELKEDKLTSDEMRIGLFLFQSYKGGAKIIQGIPAWAKRVVAEERGEEEPREWKLMQRWRSD